MIINILAILLLSMCIQAFRLIPLLYLLASFISYLRSYLSRAEDGNQWAIELVEAVTAVLDILD